MMKAQTGEGTGTFHMENFRRVHVMRQYLQYLQRHFLQF